MIIAFVKIHIFQKFLALPISLNELSAPGTLAWIGALFVHGICAGAPQEYIGHPSLAFQEIFTKYLHLV